MTIVWQYDIHSKDEAKQTALVRITAGEVTLQYPGAERIDIQVTIPWQPELNQDRVKEWALARLQALLSQQMMEMTSRRDQQH
jgi:hypothetical protein